MENVKKEGDEMKTFTEADGKTYSIDDYVELVKSAVNEKSNGYRTLETHAKRIMSANKDVYINPGGRDWYDAWLLFLIKNGKAVWAADALYSYRNKYEGKEPAILALELGVTTEEKEGRMAPSYFYHIIEEYYYKQLESCADEERRYYLKQRVGNWYNKAVAAGVDPDWMDGAMYAKSEWQTNNTNSKASSGGCYIATAVYGSYDCPEVWTLRRYRDEKLLNSTFGRLFVKVYYATSPTVVRLFGRTKWFNEFWRGRLDAMVRRLNDQGYDDNPYYDR